MSTMTTLSVSLKSVWILAAGCLAGCGFVHDQQIDGPYRTIAIDSYDQMAVCYGTAEGLCADRVPETVVAVGWNSAYVVVERRVRDDKPATEYYYIIRSLDGPDVDPSVSVRGPFTEAEFAEEKRRLGLPHLTKRFD